MISTKNSTNLSDNLWVFFIDNSNPNAYYNKMFKRCDILPQKWLHFRMQVDDNFALDLKDF